ncbi:serine hydrolase [Tessaracoccus sp. Y36]
MPRSRLALAAVVALALSACSGATEPPAPEPTTASAEASATASPTPEAVPVELPDTPVGEAAQWVLDLLAADAGPTAEEAEERLGDQFLGQVPADQVGQVFAQLREEGPFTLVGWDGTDTQGTAELDSPATPVLMMIALKDGKIDGLMFVPNEKAPEIQTPAEASQLLLDKAPTSSFLLAEVTRTGDTPECTPIEQRDADTVLPIASMFKLYVLGAVATAVEDGTLTWEQELTLTEGLKSLPTGSLRNEPAGTKVTVEKAALEMISNSDNTAADLLIDAVGREAVEAELETMGHHAPELNRPFLTTREAFQMAGDQGIRAKWAAASNGYADATVAVSEAQRAVLSGLPEWDLTYDETTMGSPFWDEGIDWYATAADLCAAHVNLQQRAATEAGKPVRDILAAYPGIEVPGAAYIGFKGGSVPGALGLSFYVEGPEKIRVLVLQSAGDTPESVPQPNWMASLAENTLG